MIGDALVELGRYPEAFASFDRMSLHAPSLSSYARVSYAPRADRPHRGGDPAMKLAVDAATGSAEPTAWTHVQLGKLYFDHGRIAPPSASTASRSRVFPGYAYALDALAQVLGGAGPVPAGDRAPSAQAVDAIPLPQYVATLGDLYRVTGQPRARAAAVRR